jgi:hypothetical protein
VGDVFDPRHRAELTFDALRRHSLYSRRRHLFGRRRRLVHRDYEYLWPFANTWSAVATLASLSVPAGHDEARSFLPALLDGLTHYHRHQGDILREAEPVGFESVVVPPLGAGGDIYYDDNAWLGLALVQHHRLTGDALTLALARRLFSFILSGWSSQPDWVVPGGIRWKVPAVNRSRNTCSNAPTVELGVSLHLLGGDDETLDWAIRIYDWVRQALLGSDAAYADRIAPDGAREPTVWTYNQGTMIGAGVLLHRATGDPAYLDHAKATAAAALERFEVALLLEQGAAFNAVFFRNLLVLDQVAPDGAYRAAASDYGDAMWRDRRNPRTGLFSGGPSFLNNTAPMLEIYALLAGAAPHA